MSKILLRRSSMEDLENPDVCHVKWKGKWVDQTIPFLPNKSMILGLYFEQICIGGSSSDDFIIEEKDLPKGRGKSRSVGVERVERQADRFKNLFDKNHKDYLGFTIIDVQRRVSIDYKDHEEVSVYDIVATRDSDGKTVIIDLKMVNDVDADRHPKSFGHDYDNDFTQAQFYLDLERKLGSNIVDFYYLVFDYSTKEKIKFLKYTLNNSDNQNIISRKEEYLRNVDQMDKEGYSYNPSESECETCPLECEFKTLI